MFEKQTHHLKGIHPICCSSKRLNRDGVTSIQFGYVENGAVVMSETYGSSSAVCNRRILRLNHESEFVAGQRRIYGGYITSLTFHTNQRTHEAVPLTLPSSGTLGVSKREFHSGILKRREFGGFFGSYGPSRLTSIGFYVRLGPPWF